MKKFTSLIIAAMLVPAGTMAKKQLDHTCFDSWKSVVNHGLTRNGLWESFSVNPQEGDGILYFRNTSSGRVVEIPRGYLPAFTADGKWAVARIKPFYSDTRKAKIAKKKDFDLPQDSLAIIDLSKLTVEKIPSVISYKTGKDGGDWVAYKSCDTTYIKPASLKDKKAGKPLVVRHLPSGKTKVMKWVDAYTFSNDGSKLAISLRKMKKDSVTTEGMGVIMFPDTSFTLIDRDRKFYGVPVFDEKGEKLAFTVSGDTLETGTKRASVLLASLTGKMTEPVELKVAQEVKLPEDGKSQIYYPNQYTKPEFSHNGKRLIVGIAPEVAPDDTTIVAFERAGLDIWRWNAPFTPPQEKSLLNELKKKTFPVVVDLEQGWQRLVTDNPLVRVEVPDRWDGDKALLLDPSANIISHQWDYTADTEMRLVNLITGETKKIGSAPSGEGELSPSDRFVVWFKDCNYYSYDITTGETRNISEGIEYPLFDEDSDRPRDLSPYGNAGWSEKDQAFLVYDRHDIWSLDPTGGRKPENLTNGEGRRKGLRFRYIITDRDQRFVKTGEEMLLSVFDYSTKENGLALLKYGKPANPAVKTLDKYQFTQIAKAKNAPVYSWQRANFNTSPDIWLCKGINFAKAEIISDANPQMKDYSWGTAQLEKWYTYDGRPTEGVLYVPEDFDPNKKYPMLAVFYETNSENLYKHYTMEPSWSWVNYPFYVSRGYVILVPDIHYTSGVPGESAYQYVCSGVEEMCKRYPWIDKDRIGIDGQSWGGYQTSYLVTRTDMFACAGSGAPVSNMTSAYGGIRWGSGDSRQAQYERGQSRIGRNLWDSPYLYMANSPIFFADRVNTPLLIMHNDEDGAVPWWQGIEMFMALRRLGKPVWMLQYNGEAHNLNERRNRKDITVRLQQFFDHYLKGDPMPEWMKNGIPMIRKGQEMGY